jgi:hypothetical protein
MTLARRVGLIASSLSAALLLSFTPAAHATTDTTPPNVTLDGGMFIKVGSVLSTSDPETARVPFNMTWSVTDSSPIASEVAWFDAVKDDETQWDHQEADLPGSARQFTVNAYAHSVEESNGEVNVTDSAGNESGKSWEYNTGYADVPDATSMSSGWTVANCNCWMNGSTSISSKVGSSVTFTMGGNGTCDPEGTHGGIGDSVGLIGDYASTRGTAKVYVDGKYESTITEKGATKNRVVVWQRRYKGWTPTTHTIKVVVASGRFDIDGLEDEAAWNSDGCGG